MEYPPKNPGARFRLPGQCCSTLPYSKITPQNPAGSELTLWVPTSGSFPCLKSISLKSMGFGLGLGHCYSIVLNSAHFRVFPSPVWKTKVTLRLQATTEWHFSVIPNESYSQAQGCYIDAACGVVWCRLGFWGYWRTVSQLIRLAQVRRKFRLAISWIKCPSFHCMLPVWLDLAAESLFKLQVWIKLSCHGSASSSLQLFSKGQKRLMMLYVAC